MELLERLAARETSPEARQRFEDVMEAVRRHERATANYAQRAARIAEMEAELADAKITARLSSLLTDGTGDRDVIATVESHAEGVLRPSQFSTTLEQRLRELEEEIAERKLTAQAKELLQSAHGLSEEQAHLHLRMMSRRTRKPLKEVARGVIEERTLRLPRSVLCNPAMSS